MINKKIDEVKELLNSIQNYLNNNGLTTQNEQLCEIVNKQQIEINKLQTKIYNAIKYYEDNKQECVIGRNKEEKLIKEYYLPSQLSVNLIKILKGE